MNVDLESRKRIINYFDKIIKPYQYHILKIFRNTTEKFTVVSMLFLNNYFFKKMFVIILPIEKLKLLNPIKVPIILSITIKNQKIIITGKNFENVKYIYFDDIKISTFYHDLTYSTKIIYINLPVEDMSDIILNGFFKVTIENKYGCSLENFKINITKYL